MKQILLIALTLSLTLAVGCGNRTKATAHYKAAPTASASQVVQMSGKVRYAKKRGFSDLNCDGSEDMLEINDKSGWFESSDFRINMYSGEQDDVLVFSNSKKDVAIPTTMKWFSEMSKIDTAILDKSGCSSVIFSQYTSGWKNDKFDFSIAFNNGDLTFSKHANQLKLPNGNSLASAILMFVDAMGGYDSEESIYDYLKLDWADFNGDGIDDFVMLWDDRNSLYYEILITDKVDRNEGLLFSEHITGGIDNYTWGRSISNVDTEDYNGDGLADIVIYRPRGKNVEASFALNDGNIGFTPYKDVVLNKPENLDFFASAKKYDTFDVNKDGQADFVYVTERDDAPIYVYWTLDFDKKMVDSK